MAAKKRKNRPTLKSLIVCDEIIRDERTKKTSLINIFNNIMSSMFPVQHSRMVVHIALTDGRGTARGKLRLLNSRTITSDSIPIFEAEGNVTFPNPLEVVNLVFDLHNVTFPEAGNYLFEFLINDQIIGSSRFSVQLSRGKP
jgi:hypothetical protein